MFEQSLRKGTKVSSQYRVQVSECHWCATQVVRSAPDFVWETVFDTHKEKNCTFHPIAWDEERFESTGIEAPHMSTVEVYDLVRNEYVRRKAIEPLREVTDNVVSIARRAQRTSRDAARKLEPHSGTIRYEVYTAIKNNGGMTDSELETLLKGKHQTVSASRRSLVVDGFIVDSGTTRKNSSGNECIVWKINTNLTQGVLL